MPGQHTLKQQMLLDAQDTNNQIKSNQLLFYEGWGISITNEFFSTRSPRPENDYSNHIIIYTDMHIKKKKKRKSRKQYKYSINQLCQ